MDRDVLVQRTALDIVSILFPFHQSFLLLPDLTSILTAALHTLLKRDVSLSRRLYVWLLGTQVDKSSLVNCIQAPPSDSSLASKSNNNLSALDASYFEKYSEAYLSLSLSGVMVHSREAARLNSSKVDCILPYRMLRALQERPEIGESIVLCVMLDLVKCLKAQIDQLGGVVASQNRDLSSSKSRSGLLNFKDGSSKKSGKRGSLKGDIIQSASLLFSSLNQDCVWGWMETMLMRGVADVAAAADEREESLRHEQGRGDEDLVAASEEDTLQGTWSLSPVGDLLDSVRDTVVGGGGGGGERGSGVVASEESTQSIEDNPLSLKSLLALFVFLMQIMPKVKNAPTMQHFHC